MREMLIVVWLSQVGEIVGLKASLINIREIEANPSLVSFLTTEIK